MVLTKLATSYVAAHLESPTVVLRSYRSALKALSPPYSNSVAPWRASPAYIFLKKQFLDGQTDERGNLLRIYTTHLESLHTKQALQRKYKGKGERSIEESAGLVGLK